MKEFWKVIKNSFMMLKGLVLRSVEVLEEDIESPSNLPPIKKMYYTGIFLMCFVGFLHLIPGVTNDMIWSVESVFFLAVFAPALLYVSTLNPENTLKDKEWFQPIPLRKLPFFYESLIFMSVFLAGAIIVDYVNVPVIPDVLSLVLHLLLVSGILVAVKYFEKEKDKSIASDGAET